MSLLKLRRTKDQQLIDQRLATGRDGLPTKRETVRAAEQLLQEARKR